MVKKSDFWKVFWAKTQKAGIHISVIIITFFVIGTDNFSKNIENSNLAFASDVAVQNIDAKKADAFFTYLTDLVPPLNTPDMQGRILTEGNAYLTKPGITNTIISTLPRDSITTYTVSEGDTYWTIAYKYELDIDTLLWANNIVVANIDKIKVGDQLTILPVAGLLYTSVEGDTAKGISDAFNVPIDKIMSQNKLASNIVPAGTQIVLPGAKRAQPKPAITNPGNPVLSPGKTSAVPNYAGDSYYYTGTVYQGTGTFTWPIGSATRFISQYFGWVTKYYKHTGVDLDWRNGTNIIAADAGTVVAASYGWGGGYGNHIIIDHGNGYQTLYGHLSSIGVKVGQNVDRGQTIGVMGTTGNSTGVHLHFEVRQGGVAINPLIYIK